MTEQTNGAPSRPSQHGKEIDFAVAADLLPKVVRWLKGCGETDINEEEIKEQLAEAAFMNHDGYKFAKELESSCGWDVDSGLVDILDNATFSRMRAHKSLVQTWVTQHGISPKFSVGQRVTFKKHRFDKEMVVGEVTKVVADEANYLVFCESLGHVKIGNGTHGIYVPYEDAQEAK